MRSSILAVLAVVGLCACATPPPASLPTAERIPRSEGFAPLRFTPNADTLDPFFAKVLDWPARAARECSSLTLVVRGLPDPSEESLEGRRAANLARALQSFGVPLPRFELGDEQDRDHPSLNIFAQP